MSIPTSTLNTLLSSYIVNITLTNDILALGANDFLGGLGSALDYQATDSINILKTSVSANDGLLLSVAKGNISLLNYYVANATNHNAALLSASQYQNLYAFNAIVSYVSDVDTLFLSYVNMQNYTEVTNLLSSNPTNKNTALLNASSMCDPTMVDLLLDNGATNYLEAIEIIKNMKNNSNAELILTSLLAKL